MNNLYEQIHMLICNTIKSMKFTDYRIGTVLAINPVMKIKVSDRLIITDVGDNIMLTEQVLEKKLDLKHKHTTTGLSHSHSVSKGSCSDSLSGSYDSDEQLSETIVINEGLKVNDKILMLQVDGGQKFIVLSKLRDCKTVTINALGVWKWS